jgi:zinc transport system substrate-binding protein
LTDRSKVGTIPPMSVLVLMSGFLLPLVLLASPAAAAVSVVATIFPIADIVRQVGGPEVEVATLLPAGASPHTFEPAPAQIRQVAQAQLFVRVGGGLDDWTQPLLSAAQRPLRVVTLTDGVTLLPISDGHTGGSGGDPHIWLDPILVRDHVVPALAGALTQAAPDSDLAVAARTAAYGAALTRLDADIRAALTPVANRHYVSFHAAWRYFARRYDLVEVAAVEPFPGKEPSARDIASLVERARALHVRAVLVEPQYSARTAEQIAREIGARVATVDPLGGPQVPGRTSYIDLMRYNRQQFVEALQ